MNWPAIHQYTLTVENPAGMFRTLREVICERDIYGRARLRSGGNAVVYPIRTEGKPLALKCALHPHVLCRERYGYFETHPSPCFAPVRYLPDEIYVHDLYGRGFWYDAVISEWQEGITLETALRQAVRNRDTERIGLFAQRFDRMGRQLLEQPWAHGDIKPENILVLPDGELRLVDMDAAFVPTVSLPATETGTPNYQHPARDARFQNRHLDDYSIALISTSLHALALEPSLYEAYNNTDNILFIPEEIVQRRSAAWETVLHLFTRHGKTRLYRLARLLASDTPHLTTLASCLDALSAETRPIHHAPDAPQAGTATTGCSPCGGVPRESRRPRNTHPTDI